MPALSAGFRIDARALRFEPAWPAWALVLGDYRFSAAPGFETAEFADGALRHGPAAASTILRRAVAVEIPHERIRAWRRFLATAPGRELRWRDPEDGVLRRAIVQPGPDGIEARQVRDGAGRPVWRSDLTLIGFADDTIEEA